MKWTTAAGMRCEQLNYAVTTKRHAQIRLNQAEHSEWKWAGEVRNRRQYDVAKLLTLAQKEVCQLACSPGMATVFTNAFKAAEGLYGVVEGISTVNGREHELR